MAEEIGWLIERADTKPEALLYFHFLAHTEHRITIKHWGWTADHLQATRFSRKIDAELAWQCVTERPLENVDIVEHLWVAISSANGQRADAWAAMKVALGYFLADERFDVAVGGNPIAVDHMLVEARTALRLAEEAEKGGSDG